MIKTVVSAAVVLYLCVVSPPVFGGTTLFQENFDDVQFTSRGWYDSTGGAVSPVEHIPNSTGSFECKFIKGGTGCSSGTPKRHALTPSDRIYVSYWVKHSSTWVGSGTTYHPHLIYLLTNLDNSTIGPAYTHMTAYVEENQGYPILAFQDGMNIDETKINVDLTTGTESRATGGCNGTQAAIGQYHVDCYLSGTVHWNGVQWRGATPYFFDPNQMTNWHFIEAYFQLNTISSGVGQPDGIVRYWYDGQLVIDHSNVIVRTGMNPTMQFNQFMLSPYIGNGSPVDQTLWFDSLTVATSRPGTAAPSPPANLRAQ